MPPPALRVAEREADIGDVVAGEGATRAFLITNGCDEAVALKPWRNAGLAIAGLPVTVAPGALATVVLKTAEPVGGLGEFSLPADFRVEPARCGPLTLEIHGRVLQFFASEPPNLQARLELTPGSGGTAALRLARKDGAPAAIGAAVIEPFGPGASRLAGKLSVRGEAAPDGSWRGMLEVRPLDEAGLYFARLRFATGHPRQKEVTITALIRNLPPLEFFPAQLRFHQAISRAKLAAGQSPARRLFVRPQVGRPPFIPGALRTEPPFLRARWVKAPGETMPGEAALEVTLAPDAPPGAFSGTLFIGRSARPGDESAVVVSGRVEP